MPVSFISLRFERVDNLGDYRIPPETGILISSGFVNSPHPGSAMRVSSSACGPSNIQFDVKTEKGQHPTARAQDGKALIYVVEVFEKPENQLSKPPTKIGLDGGWVGANKDNSYFFFPVNPGDHHLCMTWQSSPQTIFHASGVDQFLR